MSIKDIICGTGGWIGPKPGDPDSSLLLRATPAFGGIDITISYPSVNPHALSHTILYRGVTDNFDHAFRHAEFAGTFHHDRLEGEAPLEYFYWATTVSVNGTVGELLGPASAIARPRIADYIEALSGRIDESLLGQALQNRIDKIDWLEDGITRVDNYVKDSEFALAEMITGVQATVDDATALVAEEVRVRTTSNSALAEHINTIQVDLEGQTASVRQTMTSFIANNEAELIELGGSLTGLEQELLDTSNRLDGSINDVKGELEGEIEDTNARMGTIYTVQLDAGDLIGGFGMINNSKSIVAGFDVDSFWIGRAGTKRKPFIVEGGEVLIDEAVINSLTFNKLRDESGSLIVEDGKVKADYIDTKGLAIRDNQGNIIFGAGNGLDASLVSGLGALAKKDMVTTGEVTGLGALAKKDKVTTGEVTGLGALATRDDVSTALVTGLGALATRSNITSSHISGTVPNTKISGLGALATRSDVTASHISGTVPTSKVSGLGALAIIDEITQSNSATYIKHGAIEMAMIRDLVVTNAQISGNILSSNWHYENRTGWALDRNGNFYAASGWFRGDISASTGNFDRIRVNNPNIVASGTHTLETGYVRAFTTYINTGINMPGAWHTVSVQQYVANASISSGNSQGGGTMGVTTAVVGIGDGFRHNVGDGGYPSNRIFIKATFQGMTNPNGTNRVLSIQWNLARV